MSSPSPASPLNCTTLPIVTSCSSGTCCLRIHNLTTEDVSVVQYPSSSTSPCGIVGQGMTVMFTVVLNDTYFVVGNKTKTTYNSAIPITSPGILDISVIPVPNPIVPLDCESEHWENGVNFVILGILIISLGILAYFGIRKIASRNAASIPAAQKLTGIDAQLASVQEQISGLASGGVHIESGQFVAYTGILGVLVLVIIWMIALGPLSKKETCNKCLARGGQWKYTKDNSLLCKLFGRCSCRSEFMETQCALFSAQNTPVGSPAYYEWNIEAASQHSTNPSDYLCQCCPTSNNQSANQSCYNVSEYPYTQCSSNSPSPSS